MRKTLKLKTTIIGIAKDGEEIEIYPDNYDVNQGPDYSFLYHDQTNQWLDISEPMGVEYNSWLNEINKVGE